MTRTRKRTAFGSLTIREGISASFAYGGKWSPFPHYTWGYIIEFKGDKFSIIVPSLYVRVYRREQRRDMRQVSSLTIREGISYHGLRGLQRLRFPHYTWGYIALKTRFFFCEMVPSLYVRVYRNFRCRVSVSVCSLTIREGISKRNAKKDAKIAFPHYMWGYIGHFRFFQNPAY